MGLIRASGPSSEPVTLAEAKLRLRIDHNDEDALIGALIASARESAEHELGRSIIATTWVLTLDRFPTSILLPMPRVTDVTRIDYLDDDSVAQIISPAGYQLIAASEFEAWIEPAYGYTWPTTRQQPEAVKVTYVAGWPNAAAVPSGIKDWILLAVGDLYNYRERSAERPALPHGFVASLLNPHRVWGV